MLSFFRGLVQSRFGVIITLGILAVIALAFAAGDITGLRANNQTSLLGDAVAEVGDTKVGAADLRNRVQTALNAYRQQQPTLDMNSFVGQGGLNAVLERTINGLALQDFADSIGMAISKRSVDGEIASIPAFQGMDGKFSQTNYENILRQQGLTDRGLREDIARDSIARQLVGPTIGASQVPAQLALPYASLLLERRQGSIGYIPVAALGAGNPPSAAELTAYYNRQRARYTVPERRSLRYAVVRAAAVAQNAKPTPADIAAAYNQNRARFAPSEKRTISQVVIADQAAAGRIAAAVKGGTAIAAAARAAGLEPSTLTGVDKAAAAAATAPAVADAAFAAAKGAVVGPVRSPLGWHVLKIEGVEAIAGKTLAQATPELTTELAKIKAAEALSKIHDDLDNAIAESATFDEVIADGKLQPQTTPPLLATGINPDAPTAQPDPAMAQMAQAAFAAEQGDAPQLVQIDADGSFAVVGIGQIVPAAPRPLAQVREEVVRDFVIDRNLAAARAMAVAAVQRGNRGTPVAQALAATGLKLPPVQSINVSRADLAAQRQQLPPPVALMFSMAPRSAKLLEAPNRTGWYVVQLTNIQSGNAAGNTALIAQTRRGLGSVVGQELAAQFTAAVRARVGVKRNEQAVTKLRGELTGTASPASAN
jgi:peptidyl-prolyl cis-trans isomerase D